MAFIVITGVFSQEYNNGLNNWFLGDSIQKNAVSINFGMVIWDLSTDGFGIVINVGLALWYLRFKKFF